MDPGSADTVTAAIRAALEVASGLGAPAWVLLGIVGLGVAFFGLRALRGVVTVEPAPPPVSDGGTEADRDLVPAQPGTVPPATNAPGDAG